MAVIALHPPAAPDVCEAFIPSRLFSLPFFIVLVYVSPFLRLSRYLSLPRSWFFAPLTSSFFLSPPSLWSYPSSFLFVFLVSFFPSLRFLQVSRRQMLERRSLHFSVFLSPSVASSLRLLHRTISSSFYSMV